MSAVVSNAENGHIASGNGQVTPDNNAPDQTNDNKSLDVGGEVNAESSSVPDGGWGWMVVFASFMVHVIADGTMYSFGVFVEDFDEYFNCSQSAVGGLGSLMLGMVWCAGNINFHAHDNNNN